MEIVQAPKVATVSGAPVIARSDIVSTQGSVPVELPPEQTVQSAGDAVRVEIRAQDRQARAQDQARSQDQVKAQQQAQARPADERLVIEPETHTVVLEKKDPDTGETISQLPDETLLKLRIFSKQLADRAREREGANRREFEHSA